MNIVIARLRVEVPLNFRSCVEVPGIQEVVRSAHRCVRFCDMSPNARRAAGGIREQEAFGH